MEEKNKAGQSLPHVALEIVLADKFPSVFNRVTTYHAKLLHPFLEMEAVEGRK